MTPIVLRWRSLGLPAGALRQLHAVEMKTVQASLHLVFVAPRRSAHRSSQQLHRPLSHPGQSRYLHGRRTVEVFRCSPTACARHSSSWPSGTIKSVSEYLFSDTLDEKERVGVDGAGNQYYEVVRTFRADNSKQTLRIVEPHSGAAAADYDPASIPPQWQSWLSYSRKDPPPTADEVQATSTARVPTHASADSVSSDRGHAPPASDRVVRL